jgi:predicted secreted hydrolase
VEWWYFNGHLAEADGDTYSFHFAGFYLTGVQGIVPPGVTARVMHFMLASPATGAVVKESRGGRGKAPAPARGVAVAIGDWSMQGDGNRYRLAAAQGGAGLSLDLEAAEAPVLHGEDGVVDMGPGGQSFYYSRTRIAARGEVSAGGVTAKVSGQVWMDHQWGNFTTARVGWDWFSLQLDDGAEAMVFLVWDYATMKPVRRAGTYVGADGGTLYLGEDDIVAAPVGDWTSPRTGITYPSGWRLRLVPVGLELEARPAHPDAEFDVKSFNPLAYWEGQVYLTGRRDGAPVSGVGFAELVGYDRRGVPDTKPPPPPGG